MKSFLRYTGQIPRHALKQEWGQGTKRSLQEVYNLFGNKCPHTDKMDRIFVEWVFDCFIKQLGSDFEFYVDERDLQDSEVASKFAEELSERKNSGVVEVESGSIKSSSSLNEAEDRLRNMRHPDSVGKVERDSVKVHKTIQDKIRDMPKPGEIVITGDDLENSSVRGQVSSRDTKKYTSLVLNEVGEVSRAIPTTKEQQSKINSGLSEVSTGVKVLEEKDLRSGAVTRVITGTDGDRDSGLATKTIANTGSKQDKKNIKTTPTKKTPVVNKNFKAYPSITNQVREITIESIIDAPNKLEAKTLIQKCKDTTVLKVSKLYFRDQGKHDLAEIVEAKLRLMPMS